MVNLVFKKGLTVKKGTTIQIPIYAIHRNPDLFGEDVDIFDPERFLNGAAKELINNHIFHAFGGGPRVCIGMRFAMVVMKITMAKLLYNFKIIEEPNVTKHEIIELGNLGNPFLLSYKEMKVRIQVRHPPISNDE